MKVDCLYRIGKFGEIIRTKYDTETGLLDGVPEEMFHILLEPSKWAPGNYADAGTTFPIGLLERFMLYDRNCCCCIEIDNLGFYVIIHDQVGLVFGDDLVVNPSYSIKEEYVPFKGEWIPIAYRPTKCYQYSTEPILFRLMAEKNKNICLTQEGIFKLNFSVNAVSPVAKSAKGYGDIVTKKLFAVAYNEAEEPRFLKVENGYIKFA